MSSSNMKTIPPFEINVALIGYVSVGKSTFLNALLKDKYSEVSMKRCTAGINKFRIHTSPKDTEVGDEAAKVPWTPNEIKTADVTLEEITKSNKALRDQEDLHEESFDIYLEEPLFEMKENTNLVLIDVPGINEAGSSKKYKDYVNDHWHDFDMVIVVLDGKQGVNTEEQVALLKLTKANCEEIKNVPVTILMNKIDDPDDEEQLVMIEEAKEEVENIFQVEDRSKALENIVSGASTGGDRLASSPAFIPMSGIHAFIYRAAKSLDFETFKKKIDKNQIEKIGKESYGRKWKSFDDNQKEEKAYEIVRDSEQVDEGLAESNFGNVLKVLSFYLAGTQTQNDLIAEQIKVSTKRLKPDGPYVEELTKLFNKSTLLGQPTDFVFEAFLKIVKQSIDNAFDKFREGPTHIHVLSKPMQEINSFMDLLFHMRHSMLHSKEAEDKVAIYMIVCLSLAKSVVLRQIEHLLNQHEWNERGEWRQLISGTPDNTVLMLMYGSVTGIVPGDFFDDHFGSARILLEALFHEYSSSLKSLLPTTWKTCGKCDNKNSLSRQKGGFVCYGCKSFFFRNGSDVHDRVCWYCRNTSGFNSSCEWNSKCSRCQYTKCSADDAVTNKTVQTVGRDKDSTL